MSFPQRQRESLLALKGVGPTVILRLEQLGYESLADLAKASVDDVVTQAVGLLGSNCWKNSPQARAAIDRAIALAREASGLAS